MKKKGRHLKPSPKLRPRRRASQTYFFKYQLARNPLKAEEEDLKQALIASLQHCSDDHEQETEHGTESEETEPEESQPQTPPKQPALQETAYNEEYLKRPETEDFLTFICFRVTAQASKDINVKLSNDNTSRRSTSPYKSSGSNHSASNNGGARFTQTKVNGTSVEDRLSKPRTQISSPNHHLFSPSNRRRPTRQSPRLASSSRKISEIDSLNHYTAYEEDIKRAQIALEDMAQVFEPVVTQNSKQHLVKGLMTREFAGAFADEEIIFESIKNHKL